MFWRPKKGVAWRFLDNLAGIHDTDAMRHLRHDAQVVRNQQHTHAALGLKTAQQVEDLRLNSDVERRRRLVGNQQFRVSRQRDGDHHALFHAAGELEREFAQTALCVGDSHGVQQFKRPSARYLASHSSMAFQHFGNLPSDG